MTREAYEVEGRDPETGIELLAVVGWTGDRPATATRGETAIRVAIMDAGRGAGPCVDVARYIVSPPRDVTRKGAKVREGRTRLGYLQPFEAEGVADLLSVAVPAARGYGELEVAAS